MDTQLRILGRVRSSLDDRWNCPKMEHEGGVEARIEIDPAVADALRGLEVGQELFLFTWFHEADRECLEVHPRGDVSRAKRGVFSTRSPDRPNPIGLHRVTLRSLEGLVLTVAPLEAIDNTPVVDIKPFASSTRPEDRRTEA